MGRDKFIVNPNKKIEVGGVMKIGDVISTKDGKKVISQNPDNIKQKIHPLSNQYSILVTRKNK